MYYRLSKAEKYDACFVQEEAVSKDAKRLSIDKSTCLKANSGNLWLVSKVKLDHEAKKKLYLKWCHG
jgi:hypothetical protein